MVNIKRFKPVLESKTPSDKEASNFVKLQKQISDELGLNLELTAVFGFGVGFFYPIVYNLVEKMSIEKEQMTEKTIVMLTICVFAILFKDNKKDIKKLLEELRMNGTYGIAKKLVQALECIKEFLFIIIKNLGKSVVTMVDIFSYTTIFVPCAMALNTLIETKNLNLDQFVNNFITIGIGVVTITAKHYIVDVVKRLKEYFKLKIDDSKLLSMFKTKKGGITVKKFSEYSKDEIINETGLESEKYLAEVENEVP